MLTKGAVRLQILAPDQIGSEGPTKILMFPSPPKKHAKICVFQDDSMRSTLGDYKYLIYSTSNRVNPPHDYTLRWLTYSRDPCSTRLDANQGHSMFHMKHCGVASSMLATSQR